MYLSEEDLKKIFDKKELRKYYEVGFDEQTFMLVDKAISEIPMTEDFKKKLVNEIEERMKILARVEENLKRR